MKRKIASGDSFYNIRGMILKIKSFFEMQINESW